MPLDATTIRDAADTRASELVDLVRMTKAVADPCKQRALQTVLMATLDDLADREVRLIAFRLAEREADRRPIHQGAAGVQESMLRRSE